MRIGRVVLGTVVAIGAVIQLVPVDRSNPPVSGTVDAPAEVMAVLRKACFDCHSNETSWPWYSYVAPVSWLVAHDVEEGRKELNFSAWASLEAKKRAHKRKEVWEEVAEGEMPLRPYLLTHPQAKLDAAELEALRVWANGSV